MKYKNYRFIFLLITVVVFSCNSILKSSESKLKKDDFNYFSPIFEKNSDSLDVSISTFEITNLEYRNFLNFLKKNDSDKYSRCLPDSILWLTSKLADSNYKDSLFENYHSSHEFSHYPVVNISKENAKEYINWLNSF